MLDSYRFAYGTDSGSIIRLISSSTNAYLPSAAGHIGHMLVDLLSMIAETDPHCCGQGSAATSHYYW